MKKLLFGAAAALMLVGAASCDKKAESKSTVFSAEAADSLVTTFGEFVGTTLNTQIAGAMQQDSTLTKDAFLRGLNYAFGADTTQAYLAGMNLGMQMLQEFSRFEKMGVSVDRARWMNAFKQAFMADSVPDQVALSRIQGDFQKWNDSLRNAKRAFDLEAIANSPESQANLAAGKKYIDDMKAKDAAVKVDDNGMGYKIETAGEGTVKPTDRVTLKVTATALKGENPPSIPSNPVALTVLPKGVQTAVKMLGKGGKGTFYIPGAQLYELDMAQRMGLEPNGLVTYEIEVLDIQDQSAPVQPAQPGQPQVVPVK